MEFNTENQVVKLCAEGMEFERAWNLSHNKNLKTNNLNEFTFDNCYRIDFINSSTEHFNGWYLD